MTSPSDDRGTFSYTVTLYFAEPTFDAVGSRLFNVSINGKIVLSNFDVFLAAELLEGPGLEIFAPAFLGKRRMCSRRRTRSRRRSSRPF